MSTVKETTLRVSDNNLVNSAAEMLLRELQKGLDSVQKDSDWLSEAEVRMRLGLEK